METPRSLMEDLLTFLSGDAKRMWRQLIKLRDGNRCTYCGSTENLTIDHVRPQCHGGETNADNCVTACLKCNQAKGSMALNDFLETLTCKN
jgi:5-methylcytosine-specific restriction endonuclease McrA